MVLREEGLEADFVFGCLAWLVGCLLGWPAVGGAGGTEAVVEFWFEDDARKLENDPVSLSFFPFPLLFFFARSSRT